MGSTSESNLLLRVPHVKVKNKNEGELCLMSERLGWKANDDSFSVSHNYREIKTQKVSPDGSKRVQLQVFLYDGSDTTFQFVNPGGSADQMADRDQVKILLMELLQKFKQIINKEMEEEKRRLLTENPQLTQLYVDLVQSKVLLPEEFWTDHAHPFVQKLAESRNVQQDVGVSTSFLTDLKPVSDGGCNTGARYNVTGELMASIFQTYPSIKQKHLSCVPAKMTEKEFWSKFFQSHYFFPHVNIMDTKGMFADCGKQDEQVVKDMKANINDPLLNLSTLYDVNYEESSTNSSSNKLSTIANRNLIRRFNHHSIFVLKASEQLSTVEPDASAVVADTPEPQLQERIKRARLQEANYYDDLESKEIDNAVQLHLSHEEPYLNGPTAAMQLQTGMNGNVSGGEPSSKEFSSVVTRWMRGVPDKGYNPADVLSSVTTLAVMTDLSVGGPLMKPNAPNSATRVLAELQNELKQLYSSLNEILRHFWAAFPPSTPELAAKVSRKIKALERFKLIKLSLFEQKLIQATSMKVAENVLRPLKFQLDAAKRRHAEWDNQ